MRCVSYVMCGLKAEHQCKCYVCGTKQLTAKCSEINRHHSEFLKPILFQILQCHVHLMVLGDTFMMARLASPRSLNIKGKWT
jgi:hypothetical protein